MIMYCCICGKKVGFEPKCSKQFRHTWTRIDGVCQYVTICDECWQDREWCMPTKKEEALLEKERGKNEMLKVQKKTKRKRKKAKK